MHENICIFMQVQQYGSTSSGTLKGWIAADGKDEEKRGGEDLVVCLHVFSSSLSHTVKPVHREPMKHSYLCTGTGIHLFYLSRELATGHCFCKCS